MEEVAMSVLRLITVVSAAVLLLPSCASLEGLRALVQPPTFRQTEQPAEVRLAGPSVDSALRRRDRAALDRSHQPEPVRLHPRYARRNAVPRRQPGSGRRVSSRPASRRAVRAPSSRSSCRSVFQICRDSLTSSVAPPGARRWTIASTARSAWTPGRLGQPVFGPMTLMRGDLSGEAAIDGSHLSAKMIDWYVLATESP